MLSPAGRSSLDSRALSLSKRETHVYNRVKALSKRGYSRMTFFQDNLVEGRTNNWNCRAGARYLYICEDGLVHYCSQQRGTPGIPLERYSVGDIRKAYSTAKSCAPACTISCVHKASAVDFWRDPQKPAKESGAGGLPVASPHRDLA